MNNNVPSLFKNVDQCIKCDSTMIFLNSIRYCETCKDCPIIIEEELKIVPKNYRPNGAQIKLASLMKIQEFIRDILNRLNLPEGQSKINELIQTVVTLHKTRGERCKGYREESAAVIYCLYENQHKLSIRRFCEKNGIQLKKFNKMYMLYKQYLRSLSFRNLQNEDNISDKRKQAKQEESEQNNIKMQQQEIIVKREENQNQREVQREQRQADNRRRYLIQSIISKIYDKVFQRPYFLAIKNDFKKSLALKVTKVDNFLLDNPQFQQIKQYYKIPCTIFGVIKANGYNISMKKYGQIVLQILHVEVRQRMLSKYHKQIKDIIRNWEGQDQTVSQSNNTGTIA